VEKTALQQEMFAGRLAKRRRHLAKWARRRGVEAWRLYDRDIPEVPLALDVYGDALTLALYKRPYEKDEADEERWLLAMKATAASALGIDEAAIFVKRRERQRLNNQYTAASREGQTRDVREGGLQFRVNLSDYIDTGLFPDSRMVRALVRDEAAGKRLLNLFCYTGAFSVYAASGGAACVDSVDTSAAYLHWAVENHALNGLAAGGFYREDVWRFLERQKTYDIIVLDPPLFSDSKKTAGSFDLKRDHVPLLQNCLAMLASGGALYFSAKGKGFSLENAGTLDLLREKRPSLTMKNITEQVRDEDYKGKRMPLWYRFEV
jgi:23S rRNA G2069 N7-methylase RlmK/C1962 C5-methylase RlmI